MYVSICDQSRMYKPSSSETPSLVRYGACNYARESWNHTGEEQICGYTNVRFRRIGRIRIRSDAQVDTYCKYSISGERARLSSDAYLRRMMSEFPPENTASPIISPLSPTLTPPHTRSLTHSLPSDDSTPHKDGFPPSSCCSLLLHSIHFAHLVRLSLSFVVWVRGVWVGVCLSVCPCVYALSLVIYIYIYIYIRIRTLLDSK